ncbi:MAG: helix-turn-helix domain-containing protein [Leptolyngbyaceae cyanobacterium]
MHSNSPLQSFDFHDADQCAAAFREWGLVFTQLEPNNFAAQVMRFDLRQCSVLWLKFNSRVEIMGQKPNEVLPFATFLGPDHRSHHAHATPISTNCIFGFDLQRETNVATAEQGFELVVVQVNQTLFHSLIERRGQDGLDTAFLRRNIVELNTDPMIGYRQYLQQLVAVLHHQPHYAQSPETTGLIRGDLLPLLMDTLHTSTSAKCLKPLRRAEIIESARDYMRSNLHRPITLADLSDAVCASRRSLSYGFQEIFGMGPMTYLKYQRLNGVRNALLRGDPHYETVTNIAHLWGFHSLGHFAKAYAAMFDETPRQTLKRRR